MYQFDIFFFHFNKEYVRFHFDFAGVFRPSTVYIVAPKLIVVSTLSLEAFHSFDLL